MDKIALLEIVSVILPSYNSEKTIIRAVNSVLNQEGLNVIFALQFIIVDDCSTDSTLKVLNEIPNIELYSNKVNSGGPNKGRNVGLSYAKGSYIMFIDHDDEWMPNKVLQQLQLKEFPIVTCGFYVQNLNKEKVEVQENSGNKLLLFEKNETFLKLLARESNVQNTYFGTLMIHSSLKNVLFEENFGVCDYDYILKILYNNSSAQINSSLFNRFSDGNNLSFNENYRKKDYEMSMKMYENYKYIYPKQVKRGQFRLNAMMGRYYYMLKNKKEALHYFRKSKLGVVNCMFILLLKTGLYKIIKLNLFKF